MQTNLTRTNNRVGGLIFIAIGALLFLGRFVDIGWMILPALAGGFLVAGIATRQAGWFIPAGIIGGISGGIFLIESASLVPDGADAEGGLFMLAFAAGWFSIAALSKLFTDQPQWWALIPGVIMALIGAAVLGVGLAGTAVEALNHAWPLGLVLLGVWVIVGKGRDTQESEVRSQKSGVWNRELDEVQR
ncbi:MAG TPA: hypothetical protein VD886_10580 [Herpetosiphonaceae bacterium]|nr:hypothetical protein [Herpetosiphonaceae bacterium]